jgi:hypothetical protein
MLQSGLGGVTVLPEGNQLIQVPFSGVRQECMVATVREEKRREEKRREEKRRDTREKTPEKRPNAIVRQECMMATVRERAREEASHGY